MLRTTLLSLTFCLLFVVTASAQDYEDAARAAKIRNAISSSPMSIAANATIMDWPATPGGDMAVLREGNNGWTCLPDMPDTPGDDPMCLDAPWMQWADAWMNKKEAKINKMGFGYMLRGASPQSNTDPYAEGPTDDNEWLDEGVPHLMILVPDEKTLNDLPTTPDGGGPWVMWKNTSLVHIMAPMPQNGQPGVKFHRKALIARGKAQEAIAFAMEVTDYINKNYPEYPVEVYSEAYGNTGTIHWFGSSPDLGALQEVQTKIGADPEYQAILAKATDLFVEGSLQDKLLMSF